MHWQVGHQVNKFEQVFSVDHLIDAGSRVMEYPTMWSILWCIWYYLPPPQPHPPSSILNPRGQTDVCENITLSKLRLQAVKMSVTVTVAINWYRTHSARQLQLWIWSSIDIRKVDRLQQNQHWTGVYLYDRCSCDVARMALWILVIPWFSSHLHCVPSSGSLRLLPARPRSVRLHRHPNSAKK